MNEYLMTFYIEHPEFAPLKLQIDESIKTMIDCYKKGGKILVCGNGGSSGDSAHIVGELMKGCVNPRKTDKLDIEELDKRLQFGIPAIDLTAQSGLITAACNDIAYEVAFSQQVFGYSYNSRNDILIVLSTSGNSKSVVEAVKTANALGLKSIAFTGSKDSQLSALASIVLKAPSDVTFRVQESHLRLYHYICQVVEESLFPEE